MPQRTVQEKLDLIDAWIGAVEQISQRQYCLANGIHPPTFNKWLSQQTRLRATAHAKKNAQRTAIHQADTNQLQSFVRGRTDAGIPVTVPGMLDFAERERLLGDIDKYLARYMFCRRILFGYRLENPEPPGPTLFADAATDDTVENEDLDDKDSDIMTVSTVEDDHDDASSVSTVSTVEQVRQEELGDDDSVVAFGERDEIEGERVPGYVGYVHVCKVVSTDTTIQRDEMNYGRCGCTVDCNDGCINRVCSEDCNKRNCSKRGACSNRWIGKTVEQRFELFDTERTEWGLRARGDLPAGKLVLQYCGDYITTATYETRCVQPGQPSSTYFIQVDAKHGIDARHHGNLARFINHSCVPNLKAVKRVVKGTVRVFFVTIREIRAREEVTFFYGDDLKFVCNCATCDAARQAV